MRKLLFENRILETASVLLYIASLFAPAFALGSAGDKTFGPGWFVLAFGWFTCIFPTPACAWLANPLLLFSWITSGKKKSLWFATIALLLAGVFYVASLFNARIATADAEYEYRVQLGYWIWVSAIFLQVVNEILMRSKEKTSRGFI
jgi:hypothetical protein